MALVFSLLLSACQRSVPLEAAVYIPTITPAFTPVGQPTPTAFPQPNEQNRSRLGNIIPRPVSDQPASGTFTLAAAARIFVEPDTEETRAIGQYLSGKLGQSTGFDLPVTTAQGAPGAGNLLLTTRDGDPDLGEEGYELRIQPDAVTLSAYQPEGLFRGIQTLRQLLPAGIENETIQDGPWSMPAGTIRDKPRFAWRGTMLDVARHFFTVRDVERYIDELAYYKINAFHMHLSDDQGWRIMIKTWPRLAEYGGSTQVGGGGGGYYTQEEFAEIAAYAQSRYITLIPEIDLPGHTNAALASYPDLSCGKTPELYTGIEVGFSSLCLSKGIVDQFLEDIIKEMAGMTPGPYLHIGGDEAQATDPDDYKQFVEKIQAIAQAHGKQVIGWEDLAQGKLLPTTVLQAWNKEAGSSLAKNAAQQGSKIILSVANVSYMDMKYTSSTQLGLDWAGLIEVKDAYSWDPAKIIRGLPESSILGLEAPLWSETLLTLQDIEYMAFPRILGYAELGWSPAGGSWDEYKLRLAAQGPRLAAMGINYYASPQVPWETSR